MKVYTDIVGDLFHYGHVNLFKKIKDLDESVFLIVGVCSDEVVEIYKRKPILNLEERCQVLESCKYIDKIIPNCIAPVTNEFINENDIDLVVHAGNLTKDFQDKWYGVPIKLGKYLELPYTKSISTTQIINRIIDRFKDNVNISDFK